MYSSEMDTLKRGRSGGQTSRKNEITPTPHQPDAESVDGNSGIALDLTFISICSQRQAALFKQ